MDCHIDRVYKYLENEVIPKMNNTNDLLNYIVENIYNNLVISLDSNITKEYIQNRLSNIENYKKQLQIIKEIPMIIQRSDEWFNVRKNLITASDMAQALNKGKFGSQKDFLIKKINNLIENNNTYIQSDNVALLWGVKYEEVANKIYMKRNKVEVFEFGLIKHPTISCFGASPDGISELGIMLEIKCPFKRKIDGSIPEQYWMQIQGQLEVCDLEECDYLECKLKQYNNEADFLSDSHTDYILTKDLNEKGIVIEYKKDGERNYLYSDLNKTISELVEWKEDIITEFDYTIEYEIVYWRLDEYFCKRVYRDKEFFNKNIENLKYLWDKILYYSKNKNEYSKQVLNSKKKRVFEFKEHDNEVVINGFSFIEDKEEDYIKL
jgi:putative phage-type endonuclease